MLTYQDYLQNANLGAGSETGSTPFTEAQWNALSPEQQWTLVGGSPSGRIGITQGDPRYQRLAALLGGDPGRTIMAHGQRVEDSNLVDPARQVNVDGAYLHSEGNQTPGYQADMDISDNAFRNFLAMAAAVMGGGLAYGGLAGAAGAGETAGLAGLGAEGSAGIGLGATGTGALDLGALGTAAGTAAGTAGTTSSTGALSSLGGMGNLARLGAAGLALGNTNSNNSNNSSGSQGDSSDPRSIINAMADANRVNQSTPLGSRQWSQDANGRWSVSDTLNPAEQANFQNVQGMNADVTGMARQRLAALLANQSPRARADAPLNIRFGG